MAVACLSLSDLSKIESCILYPLYIFLNIVGNTFLHTYILVEFSGLAFFTKSAIDRIGYHHSYQKNISA